MFPERDLANEFWLFVREQAIDQSAENLGERPVAAGVLDEFELDRRFARERLADLLPAGTDKREYPDHQDRHKPWIYLTLQDALIAFLIYQVTLLTRFPYTFENWTRTVVLVLADAAREPGWLQVTATYRTPQGQHEPSSEYREESHVMAISEDWSCASRETFDFILRRFHDTTPTDLTSTD